MKLLILLVVVGMGFACDTKSVRTTQGSEPQTEAHALAEPVLAEPVLAEPVLAEPMVQVRIRPSSERGFINHGWLQAYHSFSFGNYRDPEHMGFGPLRVINEDIVAGGRGFNEHGHDNMEIITYVLSGALQHRDSMGNGSIIRPGEVQLMSAGSGIRHSEFNASQTEKVHLFQIWIQPDRRDVEPRYDQRTFNQESFLGNLHLLVGPMGSEAPMHIYQDAFMYAARLDENDAIITTIEPGRRAWLQVARGTLYVNDSSLRAGDGAALTGPGVVRLNQASNAEILYFDLP